MIAHVLFSTSISLCSPLLPSFIMPQLEPSRPHNSTTFVYRRVRNGKILWWSCRRVCIWKCVPVDKRLQVCGVCHCMHVFWKVMTFWSILTSFTPAWRLRLISLRFRVVQGLGLGMLLWSIKLLSSITVQIHVFLWAKSLCFSLCWCSKKVPSMISCI